MSSWIHKPNPKRVKRIGLSLVSTTRLGWLPFSPQVRVYELVIVVPNGGIYISRSQYHSLEHILRHEALEELGSDCISVSGSSDNITFKFVVTGNIYKKELSKFLLNLLYDSITKYLTVDDVPDKDMCSYPSYSIDDLFTKISTTLGKSLTENL